MLKTILIYFMVMGLISCNSSNTKVKEVASETLKDSIYNQELARQLGADEYGMKKYMMAFLKEGPDREQDSATAARLQRAHLDNIIRMAEEGKLVLAGPFMDSGIIRGIYVFNVGTLEEARELTDTDPAVKAGRLIMELHPWYGSAALMKVYEISKQIAKESI